MARETLTAKVARLESELSALRHNAELIAVENDALKLRIGSLNATVDAQKLQLIEYEQLLNGANSAALALAALRTQYSQLNDAYSRITTQLDVANGQVDSLREELQDYQTLHDEVKRTAGVDPTPAPVVRVARPVFEFDPAVPGDWARAAKLAKANGGSVRRAHS